ncbi:MAG: chemotaxis protein CheW [Clostridia bacterium]
MSSVFVTVRIGPHHFGAPVECVTEILSDPQRTVIPRTPSLVAGVAVVRGQPLVMFDLRETLGLEAAPVPFALRWEVPGDIVLLAVDRIGSLRTMATDPLPAERWQSVVPDAVAPWVDQAYRLDDEWIWTWPADLPTRLQNLLVHEAAHAS